MIEENWCEYLDTEWYETENTTRKPLFHRLPMPLVAQMVDKDYLVQLRKTDSQQIGELKRSINIYGIMEPGTLVIDNVRVKLQDGNHRFIAAEQLGLQNFPVTILLSEGKIVSGGVKLQVIVEHLLGRNIN